MKHGQWRDRLLASWYSAMEARLAADLTFQEIRRGVQALSRIYVDGRSRLTRGAALDGAGKRAAFALFYGPLHLLLVSEIVRSLQAFDPAPRRLHDLGCGTGVAGVAWARLCSRSPRLIGVDLNPWAAAETRRTYVAFGIHGRALNRDLSTYRIRAAGEAVVVAFTVNELEATVRETLLRRLLSPSPRKGPVLVVEPIAVRPLPWWSQWAQEFLRRGGREDTWRVPVDLPEPLERLDMAAGLRHRELSGRSLLLRVDKPPGDA